MTPGENFFEEKIKGTKIELGDLSDDKFDNKIDYVFKKSALESALQGYQNALIEYRKFVSQSSDEEAAILMHSFCKTASDLHRKELGEVEKLFNQENEKIVSERGRLNGLIDAYNNVRVYHDKLTSEHAAMHERARNKK